MPSSYMLLNLTPGQPSLSFSFFLCLLTSYVSGTPKHGKPGDKAQKIGSVCEPGLTRKMYLEVVEAGC